MKFVHAIAAFSAVLPLALSGQVFPLSSNSWSNPEFRERFMGSYGVDTEVNPEITIKEKTVFDQVVPLIQGGNAAGAIPILQKAITAETSAALDFILGNLFYQEQDMARAIPAYEAAIRKFPNYYRAYLNLGRAYVSQNKFQEALKHLRKAVEIKPGDGDLYGLLGYCYMNEADYEVALEAYRMAMVLSPGNRDWRMGKLKCLEALNQTEAAIGMLYNFIEQEPANSDWWMLQANRFLELGETRKAAANLEVVRQLGKADGRVLNLLGDIYLNEEMLDQALMVYEEALSKGGVTAERKLRMANALTARGGFDAALRLIGKIEADGPLDAASGLELLNLKARIALARNDAAKAAEFLAEVVRQDPLNGRALLLLADYHLRRHAELKAASTEEATAALLTASQHAESATKLAATKHAGLLKLAQVRVQQQNFPEAAKALREAQDIEYRPYVADYLATVERLANR